jgi:amylosucrase
MDRTERARLVEHGLAAVEGAARARLPAHDADAFLARARVHLPAAVDELVPLFGSTTGVEALVRSLLTQVLDAAVERPEALRLLDHRREIDPGWFQSPGMLGYVLYVDQFAGTLRNVEDKLDYLGELGVTYLHLMPLLRSRPGPNDGGYAVMDYCSVEPELGTIDDLEHLASRLRDRGISLCVDVVINHTAREHAWAEKARAGDPAHRAYYLTFPDRSGPDRYEETLPEVFPTFAPGNFTWDDDLAAWVWTTFNRFQWDLDHRNPAVFAELLGVMLFLANRGVEILRLDAVPFTWKEMGTDCQNRPGAHRLLRAWRALVGIAAPAVVFKAEAIVPLDQLRQYLGAGEPEHHECDLAYNNQLMVMLWSSLATRDAALAAHALSRMGPVPAATSWCTYVRCHDDIGWAVGDEDAGAMGWSGFLHRRFLADFYAGRFPGSFARGADFQVNPATGDIRTSGAAASLCGIEAALESGDADELDRAVCRLVLLYSVAMSFGGVPLVYMGDELALVNDHGYLADPARRDDGRWVHRPPMLWDVAARRDRPETLEGRVFGAFRRLAATRASLPALHAGAGAQVLQPGDGRVLAFQRRHPRSRPFLCLANFAEEPVTVSQHVLHQAGVRPADVVFASPSPPAATGGELVVPALGTAWYAA